MTTTPNIGLTYLVAGQLQPEVPVNGAWNILDALAGPFAQFGNKTSTSTGLTYGYYGGRIYSNGTLVTIADGTLSLPASSTSYIQRTAAGVVSTNTTGYTAGLIPMATVVTGAASITTITDTRPAAHDLRGAQSVTVAATNITLTDAQVNCRILRFTGTLTANVVVTLPAYEQEWVMSNETTGSFTLQVQTAAGSPVTLTQGASSIIYGNGAILVAASSAGSSGGSSGAATVTIGTGVTLTPTQAANAIIRVQGTMTANAALAFPSALVQVWEISNETSGAFTLTAIVSGSAATPITIDQGKTATVWSDGTDLHVVSPAGAAGGDLTGNYPSPSLAPSGVTPGTYDMPSFTVDAKGRITFAANIGGAEATLPANPFVNGTVYQNNTSAPVTLYVPVTYNPTGTDAATCTVALGPTSSPTTIDAETRPGASTSGAIRVYQLEVPPGWYYSFTVVNSTIGTARGITGSQSYSGIGPSDLAENPATTTGLTFGWMAGKVRYGATILSVAAGTIALTASATNYVEVTNAGAVVVNTTGFTIGNLPLRTLVTGASSITSDTDSRAFLAIPQSGTLTGVTMQDYSEVVKAAGNSGTAITLNMADGNVQTLTLTGNATLSISGAAASGKASNLTLYLYQDATGSRTVTWPTTTKWSGGVAPTLSTAAGALDVVTLTTIDGGTTWIGALSVKGAA